MSEETTIDRAHAAMEAAPEDDAARMGFYQVLADGELYLLLAGEPEGGQIEPELLEMDGERYALIFDTDWRLSAFTEEHLPGQALPYAALPGRVIASMLAGQKTGLGLNLGVAPSSILIPDGALSWLASTLTAEPEEVDRPITALEAPGSVPDTLLPALIAKLAPSGGLAMAAYLATARYGDGTSGPIVAFTAPLAGAEAALAGAVQEALIFTGIEDFSLEVGFFAPTGPEAKVLAREGERIPLPRSEPPEPPAAPVPPGSDPTKPPRLKG